MLRSLLQTSMLLLLTGCLAVILAASPAIGIATAGGSFRVDRTTVTGNATLFDGTLVETGQTGSLLRLDNGVRMQLGTASRGQVYRERLLLEKGEGRIENLDGYNIETGSFRIQPASAGAGARVSLQEGDRVQVAALAGSLRILRANGALLASLEPGKTLDFDPQAAGAAPPFTVSGCLRKVDGRYLLKDDTVGVTIELQGSEIESNLGQHIEVAGTDVAGVQPAPGSTEVIRVARVTRLPGGCAAASDRAHARTSAGPKRAGISKSTKAIIGGVAIAAAGAGSTMALIGEDPKPPISR